jgi:serine/threonine-protein kinase
MKVLDFGISKATQQNDLSLTQTQSVLGTPAYMSPEQMRSAREVDGRSDVWSLGTVLFEMIEGTKPFIADSFSEMCVKVAIDPPEPMRNAPPPLAQIILRCLEKQPERRYANMAELGRDLLPLTRDPHTSQVLVDRMVRMVRRAQPGSDWDGQSTSSGTPVPYGLRDMQSAPSLRPPTAAISNGGFGGDRTPPPMRDWSGSSEPAITPMATPIGMMLPHASVSQPIAQTPRGPGATMSDRPATPLPLPAKRSLWVWVVVLALAAAAGAGIAAAMATSNPRATTPAPVTSSPVTTAPTVTPPASHPIVTPPTPANGSGTAAGSAAGSAASTGSNSGSASDSDSGSAAAAAGSASDAAAGSAAGSAAPSSTGTPATPATPKPKPRAGASFVRPTPKKKSHTPLQQLEPKCDAMAHVRGC